MSARHKASVCLYPSLFFNLFSKLFEIGITGPYSHHMGGGDRIENGSYNSSRGSSIEHSRYQFATRWRRDMKPQLNGTIENDFTLTFSEKIRFIAVLALGLKTIPWSICNISNTQSPIDRSCEGGRKRCGEPAESVKVSR